MDGTPMPVVDQRPRSDLIQIREDVRLTDQAKARKWHVANCCPQIFYPQDHMPIYLAGT